MQFGGNSADAQAAGRSDVIAAYASFGVAALAAAGSIGLFVLGERIDREAPKLTLAPMVAPRFAALALAGSF